MLGQHCGGCWARSPRDPHSFDTHEVHRGPGLLHLLGGCEVQRQKRPLFLRPSVHKWGLTLSLEQHIWVPRCLQSAPATMTPVKLSLFTPSENLANYDSEYIHTGNRAYFRVTPYNFNALLVIFS